MGGKNLVISALIYLVILTRECHGNFKLLANIRSFSNPDGMCANFWCGPEYCCEGTPCPSSCHYSFSFCVRTAGTRVSHLRSVGEGNCVETHTDLSERILHGALFGDEVFGLSNPVTLVVKRPLPENGIQFYMEIKTLYDDFIIDRIAMDVAIPVGSATPRRTYPGIFRLARVDIAFELDCYEHYYGPNCEVFCEEDCERDRCAEVRCGEHRRCVDLIYNYRCVCEPGFIGPDCDIEFDVCSGVECNFGTCEVIEDDTSNNYVCVCRDGYTGRFCETRLNGYQLQVTFHSFSNPEGMCAPEHCSRAFCCKSDRCPNQCEYFFSLCQRPLGTPVSFTRWVGEGDCEELNTNPSRRISDGSTFTDSIFGTPNPVTLYGVEWNTAGIQLFVELRDFDFDFYGELIDRFAINITSAVGSSTGRETYHGIFGLASIDLSFRVECLENFHGDTCGIFCDCDTGGPCAETEPYICEDIDERELTTTSSAGDASTPDFLLSTLVPVLAVSTSLLLAVVTLLGAGTYFCLKKRKRSSQPSHSNRYEMPSFELTQLGDEPPSQEPFRHHEYWSLRPEGPCPAVSGPGYSNLEFLEDTSNGYDRLAHDKKRLKNSERSVGYDHLNHAVAESTVSGVIPGVYGHLNGGTEMSQKEPSHSYNTK